MFIPTLCDQRPTGLYHLNSLVHFGLQFVSHERLNGVKELVAHGDTFLTGASAVGMVAGFFFSSQSGSVEDKPKKSWLDLSLFALGALLLVDTANRVKLVTLTAYSFSLKGRVLTTDVLGSSITIMLIVVNVLDIVDTRSSKKPADRYAPYAACFKIVEVVAGSLLPNERRYKALVTEGSKVISALFSVARAAAGEVG